MANGKKDGTGFAARLKALRRAAELTQRELAGTAGLHPLGVAKLEQGLREPGWATVLALADALGVATDQFRPAAKTGMRKARPLSPTRLVRPVRRA